MNINILLIILFILIVISLLLLIWYMNLYNKINYTLIRIDEAYNRIDNILKEKKDLLNRSISLIKESVKDENILKEIVKLRSRKVSNFTLNTILNDSLIEFNNLLDNHKELTESKEINTIKKKLKALDKELGTIILYYDGNSQLYNKMLDKFPTSIVANIKKFKHKELFNSNQNIENE